jgi:hypothetical protein
MAAIMMGFGKIIKWMDKAFFIISPTIHYILGIG